MTASDDQSGRGAPPPVDRARAMGRPQIKRFYAKADIGAAPDGAGFQVLLDGRPVKTPRKAAQIVPTAAVAKALAEEWDAQAALVDPATMPFTKLTNSAIDMVMPRLDEVRADIVRYAGSDLLLYRADGPEGLVTLQEEHWEPIVVWAERLLGIKLQRAIGIGFAHQPESLRERMTAHLANLDAYRLAALHVVTTLTGSALLALACLERHADTQTLWAAAHVDEDWQISQWGEDAEASQRRDDMWRDMQAATRLLELLDDPAAPMA